MAKTIADSLLAATRGCGMSIRELSLQADIPYSVAHRFVTGGAGITLQTAAKIATVLGLELRPKKKREQHADAEAESTE